MSATKHGDPVAHSPAAPVAAPVPHRKASRLWQWLSGVVPTAVVIALLAGLAIWGHSTDWKIPKFSQLVGGAPSKPADWCEEHGVPESICIACNAKLMPKGQLYGWCAEHGVAECILEHPELAQLKETPTVSQTDLERAARALALRLRPENNRSCKLHLRRIQFADQEAVEKAGIDIRLAERQAVTESIVVNGEIIYDPSRVTRLAPRAAGTVWRVEKFVGDHVRKGEVLALVDSADVGRAKAELIQAVAELELSKKTYDRVASLEDAVAGSRLQQAEADRAKAQAAVNKAMQVLVNLDLPITLGDIQGKSPEQLGQSIRFLGLPEELRATLDPDRTTANLLPVAAPRDGIVVRSHDGVAVAGEVVDTSRPLFTVVDTSRMWLMLDIPMEDAGYSRVGQKVYFRPDGTRDDYTGMITWTGTELDADTRTVKVKAELPNEDGKLLNESFGKGRIVLREESNAIVVPKEAVHWEGCCNVVFVRDKHFMEQGAYKVFHTRMVRPGVTSGDFTELIAGVLPGEVVVTKGSGVLRAELLKGNLGAG